MEIQLHANARTTPKTRAYIQESKKTVAELSRELGVTITTVRRWKKRDRVTDGSHTRHNLHQSTSPEEEGLIIELRQRLGLSLDDITEVMNRCVNANLSRSSIYRCLKRNNAAKIPKDQGEDSKVGTFESTRFGYVHIDLKHLTKLEGRPAYVFVAIERTTRFVWVEIVENRDQETIGRCLENFLQSFPGTVHTILTDNGGEFTDRFAMRKPGKPSDSPTGKHFFDKVCAKNKIQHKLTKPFCPQTNGMVERFNRRISEAIRLKDYIKANQGKNKFHSHKERNQYIMDFVYAYNRTRLRCLEYKAPIEMMTNHTEDNTKAGIQGCSTKPL